MRRCGTCGADDRADRRVIETLPPTDRFVDPYLCDDEWHWKDKVEALNRVTGILDGATEDQLRRFDEATERHHEPPDLYDPGEPRPDPTRYAEWRKNGAGWGRR